MAALEYCRTVWDIRCGVGFLGGVFFGQVGVDGVTISL